MAAAFGLALFEVSDKPHNVYYQWTQGHVQNMCK